MFAWRWRVPGYLELLIAFRPWHEVPSDGVPMGLCDGIHMVNAHGRRGMWQVSSAVDSLRTGQIRIASYTYTYSSFGSYGLC